MIDFLVKKQVDQVGQEHHLIRGRQVGFIPIGTHKDSEGKKICTKKNILYLLFKHLIKSFENCLLRITNMNHNISRKPKKYISKSFVFTGSLCSAIKIKIF